MAIDRPSIAQPKNSFSSLFQTNNDTQLLDTNAIGVRREKMYQLDGHIGCAVAGITGEGSKEEKEKKERDRETKT